MRVRWVIAALDERVGEVPGRPTLHSRLDSLEGDLAAVLRGIGEVSAQRRDESWYRERHALDSLDPGTAALLNWERGPLGFAAQAGLWFNPAVPPRYRERGVDVLHVTERIVERPYVLHRALSTFDRAEVVDLGGAESLVGLELASCGHRVTVIDPRPLPLAHANLRHQEVPLEGARIPERSVDVVIALSALEHFGLGAYEDRSGAGDERVDLEAVRRAARWLHEDGLLIFTLPVGPRYEVDGFERIYDAASLEGLLRGWEIADLRLATAQDSEWNVVPAPAGALTRHEPLPRGVMMGVARPPRRP